MKTLTTRLTYVLSALAVVLVSLAGYVYYSVTYNLSPVDHNTVSLVAGKMNDAELLRQRMKSEDRSWRQADYSSVGFPEKERVLVDLAAMTNHFVVAEGRMPETSSELSQWFRRTDADSSGSSFRGCRTLVLEDTSYILNCDNWEAPQGGELIKVLNGFQPGVEKFYVLQGHVVLFVPRFPSTSPS